MGRQARSTGKKLFTWYSDWRAVQFRCEYCGPTGKGQEAFPNEMGVMECPRCDHRVGDVEFASLKDTERAAAEGNPEDIRDLPEEEAWVKRMQARMDRFRRQKLCRIEQTSESLEFTWDLEENVGDEKEDCQIIRLRDREVWREPAFFDNILRFNEIKELLKRKYRARFKSLIPTDRSLDWLTGDHPFELNSLRWT
jgi:hypothetical protein